MRKKVIHLVVGARPNFMKIAPLFHALNEEDWARPMLVHTGQHASPLMSDAFIRDLNLPEPHFHLNARGDGHAQMTAAVMVGYETLIKEHRPDYVVVPGDVNSTLAACISAKKLTVPVAHLEAGLRSFDRAMPEEQNRVVVDALCDLLWTPSPDADENLRREGVVGTIDCVGNIMIDAYEMLRGPIRKAGVSTRLGYRPKTYAVVTLHRPSNVDDPDALRKIALALITVAREIKLVFPVHPRTARKIEALGLEEDLTRAGVNLIEPLGYVEFMSLVEDSALVLTDSGGLQEEAVHIGVPCLTLRDTTERPITLSHGNRLTSVTRLVADARYALAPPVKFAAINLWDGRTAKRAATSLARKIESQGNEPAARDDR